MCSKPASRNLSLLLHVGLLLVSAGCQRDATQIHRVTAIRSFISLDETISNVVAVLQINGCATTVSYETVRAENGQNDRGVIYFKSLSLSGAVTVEAGIWDMRKEASVVYSIKRERIGTKDDMMRLSEQLDSIGRDDDKNFDPVGVGSKN